MYAHLLQSALADREDRQMIRYFLKASQVLVTNRLWTKEPFGLDFGTSLQNAKHPLDVIKLAFDTVTLQIICRGQIQCYFYVLPAICEMLKNKSTAVFEQSVCV